MCGLNLPNGFTATVVTIGELAKGKGLLVMRSWMTIMVHRYAHYARSLGN